MSRDLTPLFEPRSVAIVGVSADPGKWGYWFARDARPRALTGAACTWSGGAAASCTGCPCTASIAELPEAPELVVLSVPAHALEQAVDESLAAGREGARRDRGRLRRARAGGRRARAGDRRARSARRAPCSSARTAWASSTPPPSSTSRRTRCPSGPIGFVSQSGNIALETGLLLADRRPRLLAARLGRQPGRPRRHRGRRGARRARGDAGDRRLLRGLPRRPRVRRDGAHRGQAGRAAHGRPHAGGGARGALAHRRADERPRRGRRRLPRRGRAPRRDPAPARRRAAGAARRGAAARPARRRRRRRRRLRRGRERPARRCTASSCPCLGEETQATLRVDRCRRPPRPPTRSTSQARVSRTRTASRARRASCSRRTSSTPCSSRRTSAATARCRTSCASASSPSRRSSPRRRARPAGRSSCTRCTGTRRRPARSARRAFRSTAPSSRPSPRSSCSPPTQPATPHRARPAAARSARAGDGLLRRRGRRSQQPACRSVRRATVDDARRRARGGRRARAIPSC